MKTLESSINMWKKKEKWRKPQRPSRIVVDSIVGGEIGCLNLETGSDKSNLDQKMIARLANEVATLRQKNKVLNQKKRKDKMLSDLDKLIVNQTKELQRYKKSLNKILPGDEDMTPENTEQGPSKVVPDTVLRKMLDEER